MSAARTPMHLRILRCAILHADTYEEVEADRSSIRQALVVVSLAAASAALGAWLETLTWRAMEGAGLRDVGLEIAVRGLEPLVLWFGGAAFAYMVGSSFFRGPETETDYAEVLRTTGFAFAPGWFTLLVCVPPAGVGVPLALLFRLWSIVAVVVAVRQALDFNTARAIGTVAVGSVLGWLVMWGSVSAVLQLIEALATRV